jgi:hypothetical protein
MPPLALALLARQIGKPPNFALPQISVPRKLAEIQGLAPGPAGACAVVRFDGSSTPELVPLTVMHQMYLQALISFYEEHIVLVPVGEPRAEREHPLPRQ